MDEAVTVNVASSVGEIVGVKVLSTPDRNGVAVSWSLSPESSPPHADVIIAINAKTPLAPIPSFF